MSEYSVLGLNDNTVKLTGEQIDDLKARIRGDVITPDDGSYDEIRQIWNAMIDRRPGLIVQCSGTADVVQAVRFVRNHGLLASVRGAGHNIAGKALHDGALLIDLSQMRHVVVDPASETVTAGPGATLGDLDHETQAHGLAVPVGINSTTGVGGLTLGGGFGWLSRKHGMTIDNLVAADVVTAKGECVRCDAEHHADLFWATRGGGGNFGIVTAFHFKAHPVGPEVMSGPAVFPFEQAGEVLRRYRDFCQTTSEDLTVWAVLRDAPPLPFLPEEHHGKRVLILAALHCGDMDEGKAALEPIRGLGDSIADGFAPHPFAGFQQAFDPLLTPGARNYWKSHNFKELSDELIDKLVEYAGKLPSSQSEIFVAQMGGAINRVASDATAYPHRDCAFVMNVHTRWDDPADDHACVAWAREFFAATEPFATGGVYVNFIPEDEDRIAGAYGGNFARLQQIKKAYDPDNLFRLNQNITPAS